MNFHLSSLLGRSLFIALLTALWYSLQAFAFVSPAYTLLLFPALRSSFP